jgi:hypothetical protein
MYSIYCTHVACIIHAFFFSTCMCMFSCELLFFLQEKENFFLLFSFHSRNYIVLHNKSTRLCSKCARTPTTNEIVWKFIGSVRGHFAFCACFTVLFLYICASMIRAKLYKKKCMDITLPIHSYEKKWRKKKMKEFVSVWFFFCVGNFIDWKNIFHSFLFVLISLPHIQCIFIDFYFTYFNCFFLEWDNKLAL